MTGESSQGSEKIRGMDLIKEKLKLIVSDINHKLSVDGLLNN